LAPSRAVSPWWRAAAIFLVVVLSILTAAGFSMFEVFQAQIAHLQARLQTVPQIRFIAILADREQAPAMLVTLDPQDKALQVQRLNAVAEGREDSMQLWALPDHGNPRSLGVLESSGKTLRLAATDQSLAGASQIAVSVENRGGVLESQGPRLPYLFRGAVVQKAL
jgi:anti-sigma-K factor RskA